MRAWCVECEQRTEYRNGAWICPTHRDLCRVTFIPPAEKTSSGEESKNMPNRTWSSDYLGRAILNQGDTWITADGRWLNIATEMTPDHALKTLLMLERVVDDLPIEREALQETALYEALYTRVETHLIPSIPDPPAPTDLVARRWTNQSNMHMVLEAAAKEQRQVRIDYTDRHGNHSNRVVTPLRVISERPSWGGFKEPLLIADDGGLSKNFYLARMNWVEEI